MSVNKCARFCEKPKFSHERSVHRVTRYLIDTKNKGLVFKPDLNKGIECYVDADFARGWNLLDCDNTDNVLSRKGYMIFYAGCLLVWMSKLQTEISLSTTKAEYIALSQVMCEIIPLTRLLS